MPSIETNHPICDRQTGASPERASMPSSDLPDESGNARSEKEIFK
jgi:hypothetical protein